MRRSADRCLPPFTLPSPPRFCFAGGEEGTIESAARLTRAIAGCLVLLILGGCGRARTPTDLNELAAKLQCVLPEGSELLAGATTAGGSFWFVQSPVPLPLAPENGVAAETREPIPAGVLAGLLAQHERTEEAAAAERVTGQLRVWETSGGTVRIREFQAATAWYTVIEYGRAASAPQN